MEISPFTSLEPQLLQYLLAFSLALARLLGVIIMTPAFTRLGMTRLLQGGVGLALAIPLVPVIAQAIASEPMTVGRMGALLMKETVAGVIVGLVMGVPFWAAELAGATLDTQRGSTMASVADPSGADETSILGVLFVIAMLAIFYGSGGLILLIGVIYDSYELWPVGRLLPLFGPETGMVFLGLLDKVLTMGVMLGAPLIIAILLCDLALALVSRAAPQLHVFDLSLGLKSLVLGALILLYSPFMFSYMGKDVAILRDAKGQLEAIAGAAGRP